MCVYVYVRELFCVCVLCVYVCEFPFDGYPPSLPPSRVV